MSPIFKSILKTPGNAVCSQVVELVMVEADPGEQPAGPPSLVQKELADWEFSEQQVETQSLSQIGLFLRKWSEARIKYIIQTQKQHCFSYED